MERRFRHTWTGWNGLAGLVATAALLAMAGAAWGESTAKMAQRWKGEARDAWIDGKIEASYALNRYLNPFAIDTHVDGGVVRLTGAVESQIDKDLAEQIAESVDGVAKVQNDLTVKPGARDEAARSEGRSFGARVDDATTTARVKIALLANDSTSGLSIHVDTQNGMVSLRGDVASSQEKQLAEKIARNTEGVQKVENQLRVSSKS